MTFQEFIGELKVRLDGPLPGESAHLRMAPPKRMAAKEYYELRNRNPLLSAVLVCFYPEGDSVYLAMMLRPTEPGHHSNQVSFPGGRVEEGDETFENTALREAQEEIGLEPSEVEVIGRLSSVYIPVSNFLVQPVVGYAHQRPHFRINEKEVMRVVEADCRLLSKESLRGSTVFKTASGAEIEAPYYEIQQLKVWGATAMMLSELEMILQEIIS
jgi:8-oxo-dGTP pyrophosphatase MutT (NUDIX family)